MKKFISVFEKAKKPLICLGVGTIILGSAILPAEARNEIETNENHITNEMSLTPEQQAVLSNYLTNVITNETQETQASSSPLARSAGTWRASHYRGSFLMFTEDNVDFTISSAGSITSTTAWQRAGFVFPNTARNTGISRHATANTSRTYRGRSTVGAGVVTPWGDVNVYSIDIVHFIRVNNNATWSWWE
ncbi:MAG: hypothetical protein FWG67_00165 [Defluviitaleaceae bacterium]|nr:hypothetical protein [Defluviitaleaceae bacterium]